MIRRYRVPVRQSPTGRFPAYCFSRYTDETVWIMPRGSDWRVLEYEGETCVIAAEVDDTQHAAFQAQPDVEVLAQ